MTSNRSRAIPTPSNASPAKNFSAPKPAKSSSEFRRRSNPRRTRPRDLNRALLPPRSPDRQCKHRHKNNEQPAGRSQNAAPPLRQNREPPVHKFDVYPIHQQGSLPKLDD